MIMYWVKEIFVKLEQLYLESVFSIYDFICVLFLVY